MSNSLSNIEATCNDFDGVLYDHTRIADYYHLFESNMAVTLMTMFPGETTYPEGVKLAAEWFHRNGDSITGVMEWADKKGLATPNLRDNFFKKFHENLYLHFIKTAPHVFAQPSDLVPAFQKTNRYVRNGIATHGCANSFTRPLVLDMGFEPFIQKDAVFGLADSAFLRKSTHPDLVKMCMEALKVGEENAAYTEDSAINLKTAKEAMPRLTTVFLNNGRPLDSKPSYIDLEYRDLHEYQAALFKALSEPRKLILI